MEEPKIVEAEDRTLIVARLIMSLANNKTREIWQGFRPRVKEIQGRKGTDFFSIQHFSSGIKREHFNPTTEFVKFAGVEVENQKEIPLGMEAYTLRGGKYAVFIHHGPATAFAKTFQYIFGQWLPNSEFETDDRDQFEILGQNYRPDDPDAQEEVWVPIR